MSARRVAAVARRIVAQFRHDRRSIGLLIVAPIVVLSLVGALYGAETSGTVRVVVASDRAVPAALTDQLRSSTPLEVATATFADGERALREGRADAVIAASGAGIDVELEGSDPLKTDVALGAIQRAAFGGRSAAVPVRASYLYGGPGYTLLDYLAPVFIALFAFFFIFLLSAVSFLRERTSGTLERLLATPLRRGELVLGYLLGFGVFALLQALVILAFTVVVLKVQYRGNVATIFLVEVVVVVGAVSLGLLVSAFARNELQAVQFVPLILLPQVFLSGFLVPVDQLPPVLRPLAIVLPLTYANEALRAVMVRGVALSDGLIVRDLAILATFGLATAAGAIASIRREVA